MKLKQQFWQSNKNKCRFIKNYLIKDKKTFNDGKERSLSEVHIEKIDKVLENSYPEDEDLEFEIEILSDNLTNRLKKDNIGLECVEPILKMMERHPTVGFGSPGSLTHYMEKFYKHGYEKLVVESIERTPTVQTIWLLNRLINGAGKDTASEYLSLLREVT